MTHQAYLRTAATIVTTLLVAALLNTFTATAVHSADDGTQHELLITVDMPTGLTAVTADIALYRWNEAGQYFEWFEQAELLGIVSGEATAFHVPSGHYWAEFSTPSFPYELPALTADATQLPTERSDIGVVEVTGDTDTTITVLPRAAVSGTVRGGDGAPLPSGEVRAYADESHPEDGYLYSGDVVDGTFTLPVEAGSWRVVVSDHDGAHDDHTYPTVTLARGEQRTLPPVTLPAPTAASVHGVAVVMGLPRAEVRVSLLALTPGGAWEPVTTASTDAEGDYSLTGVRRNTTYTVLVDGDGIVPTYLGGATTLQDARTFTHADDPYLETIDADSATTIRGTLKGAGTALPGIVSLYRTTGSEDTLSLQHVAEQAVEAGDTYELLASPGRYVLLAEIETPGYHHTWFGARAALTAEEAGSFTVKDSTTSMTVDVPALEAAAITGVVRSATGPLRGVVITPYVWEDGFWNQYASVRSSADGSYRLHVPADVPVTYRLSLNGYRSQFHDGHTTLPDTPTDTNSVTVTGAVVDVGTTTLVGRPTDLGKVAGQNHAWCQTHHLPASDDATSGPVDLPFPLRWHDRQYEEIHVNNDGNITLGEPSESFDPQALTTGNGVPMIAPLLADVDTRGPESSVVTYGASPDGTQFCATWADVEHALTDSANTYQLILTRADSGAGRRPGDFDIRFNYDLVTWDTDVAAGFTDGSGEPGSSVVLDGPLVDGSRSSTRAGRWNFEVRNTPEHTAFGHLHGRVTPIGTVATVEACTTDGACAYTRTGTDGRYQLPGVHVGTYTVRAWAADHAGRRNATATPSDITTVPDIALNAAAPLDRDGLVTDQWGRPLDGATVTLTHAETHGDPYTPVPDASPVLAPGQQTNPARSDAEGRYGWDVAAGSYRVSATAPGCDTVTSGDLEAPGARPTPTLTLTCAGGPPTATVPPALTGSSEVGSTLTATRAAWPAPLTSTGLVWLRDGVVDTQITGPTYTVTATDVDATITVRDTARRTAVTDAATGETVTFLPVSATSAGVTAVPKAVLHPPSPPGKAKATVKLKAPKKVTTKKRAKVTVRVISRPTATGRVVVTLQAKAPRKGKKTRTVRAKLTKGRATFRLPRLPRGTWVARVTYPGNAKVAPANSKNRRLAVTVPKKKRKR